MAATETKAERDVQKQYWLEHSTTPTVEAMMLDSNAAVIDQMERPEVLTTLGDVSGRRVLELGAGIGRFTGELAKQAAAVTACDFMDASIQENRRLNGHLPHVDFRVADVTQLTLPPGSYDVVFSNWLLMYLSDEEVYNLACAAISWLSDGGTLFFRESCFKQSGDKARSNNPTHYRNPREYFRMFDAASWRDPAGRLHTLQLVLCKCVDTYVAVKRNQNQICWKWTKVACDGPRPPLYRQFLDQGQYSSSSIEQYEQIYGQGYVSIGGAATTASLLPLLQLAPGQRVLEVGSGPGGAALQTAATYGVHVHAIDLSVNMTLLALERASGCAPSPAPGAATNNGVHLNGAANGTPPPAAAAAAAAGAANGHANGTASSSSQQQQQQQQRHDVTFEVADVMTRDFVAGGFDAVYSRDTLLHLGDKPALFERLFRWLKPGGRLLITDYCLGPSAAAPDAQSASFQAYLRKRGYHLQTLDAYATQLSAAGFDQVLTEDRTANLVEQLQRELVKLTGGGDDAAGDAAAGASNGTAATNGSGSGSSSDEAQAAALASWQAKLARAQAGEQLWGLIQAVKPPAAAAAAQ